MIPIIFVIILLTNLRTGLLLPRCVEVRFGASYFEPFAPIAEDLHRFAGALVWAEGISFLLTSEVEPCQLLDAVVRLNGIPRTVNR